MKIQIIISIVVSVIVYLYLHFRKNKLQKNSTSSNLINSAFIGLIIWFILDKCIYTINENKINNEISNGNIYDTENSVENEQIIQELANF
jgi:hypothetical protein